jgi:hypothetical protein
MVHLAVVVHPVNTLAHPSVPSGFRWCVMVAPYQFDDVARCANAGWTPTKNEALSEGEVAGVTAVRSFRLAGEECTWQTIELESDPIPPGGDLIHFA